MHRKTRNPAAKLMLDPRLALSFVLLAVAGCQTGPRIVSSEPGRGQIKTGQKVLVDNGSCPAGQFLQVTGGAPGVHRGRTCVPRPA